MAHANIVTLANIKGGVGKTTATVNIAYLAASLYGKRVLVVDSDDQGNATKYLGVRDVERAEHQSLWHGIHERRSFEEVMVQSPHENLCVIPASKELRKAQLTFGQSARGLKLFRHLLRGVETEFDLVLVDTKPQVNILLQAALAASHWYLIPSFPESDSYDGFVDLVAECEEVREEENQGLNCMGLFFTCIKRSAAHDAYLKFVTKLLEQARVPVFPAGVRSSDTIATGSLRNVPAVSLPNAKGVRSDYEAIVSHLLGQMREDNRGRPRVRPDLRKLGVLEDQISPVRGEQLLVRDDDHDDQLFM